MEPDEDHERNLQHRVKKQIIASIIGIVANGALAVAKITVGIVVQSMAVIGDGIDSASDIVTSVISLFAARISSKPPDQEHPYGHERAETIATKLLSFIIAFAGLQLLISTIGQLVAGGEIPVPGREALWVTGASIVAKLVLAVYKKRVGTQLQSSMLLADAKNMFNDILLSSGVLLGVVLTQVLHLPILDRLVALALSAFIIKTGIQIFMETSEELMDGMGDPEMYRKVFAAVKLVPEAANPHKVRIRRINTQIMVELDLELEPTLTIKRGHELAQQVEDEIRKAIPHIYDILIHIEPKGIVHRREAYGLREKDFN